MNRKSRSRCIIVGHDCLEKREIERQIEIRKRGKERRETTKGN